MLLRNIVYYVIQCTVRAIPFSECFSPRLHFPNFAGKVDKCGRFRPWKKRRKKFVEKCLLLFLPPSISEMLPRSVFKVRLRPFAYAVRTMQIVPVRKRRKNFCFPKYSNSWLECFCEFAKHLGNNAREIKKPSLFCTKKPPI